MILFLTSNKNSYDLYKWLKYEKKENIIIYEDIIDLYKIMKMQPTMIISYNYSHIIKKDVIDYMYGKIINLHISMLPWNRGANPNFWSFIDNTPKGVTVHLIDEGLDTGEILLQKELFFNEEEESLETSYYKLHFEIQNLFKKNWSKLKYELIEAKAQEGNGSTHFLKEFEKIKERIEEDIFNISIKQLKDLYKELFI